MNWSATVATTNDLKNGMTLDIEGQLWTVVEFQHVKPGKGPAFVRTKLKQVLTGKVVDKTFNAGVKVDIAILEKREMNFLYKEGDDFVFMDNKNFDQMTISAAIVGDASNYMLENTEAIVAIHDGNPLYIELPASVELVVTYTEPGLQGDRSSGGTKPATVETGIEVQVPLLKLLSLRDVIEEGVDARPIRDYTRLLVEGVHLHKRKIDELISTYSQGWDMDRLAAVDRNILRLGIFEILWENEIDDAIVIDEALTLAQSLSTEESAGFIHGVLGRIVSIKESLAL
jgi:elongation factor P